jgi:hypothetical protein
MPNTPAKAKQFSRDKVFTSSITSASPTQVYFTTIQAAPNCDAAHSFFPVWTLHFSFVYRTAGKQLVAISAACRAHIRPHDPTHPLVLSSGTGLRFAEEVLVIRPGDSRVGGRISPPIMPSPINDQVCTEYEVLLFTEEPELLSSFLDGLNELIESHSEHYVKRMLDFTSGRLQISKEEEGSEGEETGSQTSDMMRYTSGRVSRPSRDESP